MTEIIGITGLIGSGKGTIGKTLIEQGYTELSFASKLKDVLAIVFSWDRDMLEGATPASRKWRTQVDTWWAEKLGIPEFTPRKAMQLVGTDLFRQHFNHNIWVLALQNEIQHYDKVVITDVRFTNEYDMIKEMHGQIWHVKRGQYPEWYELAVAYNNDKTDKNPYSEYGIHPSEWDVAGLPVDVIFDNNGTLKDLRDKVIDQLKYH